MRWHEKNAIFWISVSPRKILAKLHKRLNASINVLNSIEIIKSIHIINVIRLSTDHTAPRISITSSPDPSSSRPNIQWKATEPLAFECTFDDGRPFACGEGTTGSWTGNNVPDGARRFVIDGKDKVGNTGRFIYSWRKGKVVGLDSQCECRPF